MKAKISKSKNFNKRGVADKKPLLEETTLTKYYKIKSLLDTSLLGLLEYNQYYCILNDFISDGEADVIIKYLYENQRDPIKGGFYYQMGDIKKSLKQLV